MAASRRPVVGHLGNRSKADHDSDAWLELASSSDLGFDGEVAFRNCALESANVNWDSLFSAFVSGLCDRSHDPPCSDSQDARPLADATPPWGGLPITPTGTKGAHSRSLAVTAAK
ncbi:hypothetical protein C8R45DRAFT_928138 [Mycena sanguinolenta]|nr:hypothetical protein C8R45DRAFT_928138 [Mycena sanguinolenta]